MLWDCRNMNCFKCCYACPKVTQSTYTTCISQATQKGRTVASEGQRLITGPMGAEPRGCCEEVAGRSPVFCPPAAQVGSGAAADLQGSVVWSSHCGRTALTSVPPRDGASYTGQRVQTATTDPPDVCTYVAPLRLYHAHIWTHKNSLLYVTEGSYKMLQKHRE